MDAGRLFERLEKLFTDPALGRTLFAFAIISGLVFINHEAGFLHHYDTSRQLEELRKLETTARDDPALQSRIDSLRAASLEKVKAHRRPLREKLPLWLVVLVSTLVVPASFFHVLLSILFGKVSVEKKKLVQLLGWGFLMIFAALFIIGAVIASFTAWVAESLLATVLLPASIQLVGLYGLVTFGAMQNASTFANLPDDPSDASVRDFFPDRMKSRLLNDDSSDTSLDKSVARALEPYPDEFTEYDEDIETGDSNIRSMPVRTSTAVLPERHTIKLKSS